MISYADFITLLFAFFVVLFASTYRDNQAIKKLARAIHDGFQSLGAFSASGTGGNAGSNRNDSGGNAPVALDTLSPETSNPLPSSIDVVKLRRELEEAMGQELRNHEITMQVTPEGFVISLRELGFFDSGQAELLPGASDKIARIAKILSKPGLDLRIEGHSDNQPIHNGKYGSNWELSTARAMTVLLLLVDEDHFDPTHISASGYGEFRPVADNSSPQGRRANRRVDLVVVQAKPNPIGMTTTGRPAARK
jgi:chemotaxis protein MotB